MIPNFEYVPNIWLIQYSALQNWDKALYQYLFPTIKPCNVDEIFSMFWQDFLSTYLKNQLPRSPKS